MLLGVIADDFTGASDVANTLAKGLPDRGGLRTVQFMGTPSAPAPSDCEAGVVSLKSRSIEAAEAVGQSLAALRWLTDQGCRQILFKYCSTFDSTPEGNIGPVAEALARALDVKGVAACPAFPTLGRTVYQGHLFVNDRPLDESGLERHPLNPMTDADIRRWLARQSAEPVGLVPWPVVRQGSDAIRKALAEAAGRGERLAIVDAIVDDDLLAIGAALADAPLLTGGSGIALGLPRNVIRQGLARGGATDFGGIDAPAAVLAGSCSRATRGQVEAYARDHPALALDADRVMAGETTAADAVAFVGRHGREAPLVYSSADPETVAAAQGRHGRERVAGAFERLFAETARALVASGARRLVVAGGETSGAVVSGLGLKALKLGPEIDPGVPILYDEAVPIGLALKSGNFGAEDFFARAVAMLGGARP